ncbi:MAG: SPOR domain-containing protein [Bacteroidaceae bacterium]|nr:SPOR domain-containing protein [Bacteroidaceae bacterium]
MNQFPTLIEYLLLTHDHVVIPGMGTFIVQQMEARRNENEEAFLPPYRSVRFNRELNHDDGTLLNAIQDSLKLTKENAERTLGTWVDDFNQELSEEGYSEFGAVGVFTTDEHGNMIFTPQESGVTTPEFYGLDAFHMSEVTQEPRAKVVPMAAAVEADEKEITIRINRRIANWVVAACAAVLLAMVFSMPLPEGGKEIRSSIKEMLMPASKAKLSEAVNQEAKNASATALTEETVTNQTEDSSLHATQQDEVAPETEYCIVMACAIPLKSAQRYVEVLSERGFLSARVVEHGKMVRVVVGHYPTEEAANEGAREIRQRDSEYQGAWVMAL